VLGYIVRGPLGGLAWHHLQYVLGLARLGHDVYFLEQSGDASWCCYDPSTGISGTDATYGLRFAGHLFADTGLGERWAYYDAHGEGWVGPCSHWINEIIGTADLLLNVGGSNVLSGGLRDIPTRVLIDTDPVFFQIRNLKDPESNVAAGQHNRFFSFAENIVRDATPMPRDGFPWKATRQPIVLDMWPVAPPPARGLFTTVMQWDSYEAAEFRGARYGMKSESFGPYMSLPREAGPILEIALGSPAAPRHLLLDNGWKLQNPLESAQDPWSYQAYIRQSKGEFTIAKQGYVASCCGWFSERSAAYLASGRPVVTQETGFSEWMETGRGVISFASLEGALAAVREIESDYPLHCASARSIAETYFDSAKVLGSLLDRSMEPARHALSAP
jgi:hypothetical protein